MFSAFGISVMTFLRFLLFNRLPLYGVFFGLLLGSFAASYWISERFGESLGNSDNITQTHRVVRGGSLAGDLFRDLVNANLIGFNRQTGLIDIGIDCGAFGAGFSSETNVLLKSRLCSIDIGAMVRSQIFDWNQRASMIAVRDNRYESEYCKGSNQRPQNYIPTGCYPNDWSGRFGTGNAQTFQSGKSFAIVNELEQPDPQVYGFFSRIPVEGFGDWRRFPNPEDVLEVSTSIVPLGGSGQRIVTIDYIGNLLKIDALQDGTASQVLPFDSLTIICATSTSSDKCKEVLAKPENYDLPKGGRIVYNVPRNWKGTVKLVLEPTIAVHARVLQLKKANFVTPQTGGDLVTNPDRVIDISANIQAKCQVNESYVLIETVPGESDILAREAISNSEGNFETCTLDWLASQPSTLVAQGEPSIDSDKIVEVVSEIEGQIKFSEQIDSETQSNGRKTNIITSDALDLGLSPILGFDDNDPLGLLGIMKAQTVPGSSSSVSLTIDRQLQKQTKDVLQDALLGRGRLSFVPNSLLPGKSTARKATLLLMDAGPAGSEGRIDDQTGRILSVSSWPDVRRNLSQWDLEAQASFQPTENLIAARAWSENNRLFAPGSAFKPLIALTAINQAANGNSKIANYLGIGGNERGLTASELRSEVGSEFDFGFRSSILNVPQFDNGRITNIRKIRNRGLSICSRIRGSGCETGSRLAMPDMLAASDNIYFARLALLLDADNVSTGFGEGRVELVDDGSLPVDQVHHISEMTNHIWPSEGMSLLPGIKTPKFSRLYTSAIQVDSAIPEHPRIYRLALNGIGQSAQATPLAMATIAASISSGMVVKPWLGGDPAGLGSPKELLHSLINESGESSFDISLGSSMLSDLRAAMKEVVLIGTASEAFPKPENPLDKRAILRDRLYGKTGTAQIGNPANDGNTVWFIGWLDDAPIVGYEGRRIAFACMISHAQTSGAGGGSVCGPVMRELLLGIMENSAESAEGSR